MTDLHMHDSSHGHPQGAPPWHHTTPVPTTHDEHDSSHGPTLAPHHPCPYDTRCVGEGDESIVIDESKEYRYNQSGLDEVKFCTSSRQRRIIHV